MIWRIGGLLAFLAPSAAAAATVDAHERVELALLILTPQRAESAPIISEAVRTINAAFAAETDLTPIEIDGDPAECRGRVACFVERAAARFADRPALGWLVIVSLISEGDHRWLAATIVDCRRVEQLRRASPAGSDLEASIQSHAVIARVEPEEVDRPRWIEALRALIIERLRAALNDTGHWHPYGRIVLSRVPPGASIVLDGRNLGISGDETTSIERVRSGTRRLRVESGAAPAVELIAEVTPGRATEIELGARTSSPLFWGGVVAIGGGVALSVSGAVAAAIGPTDQTPQLFARPACRGGFLRLAGGPMIVPLGYSLAGAGSVAAFGAPLLDPEGDRPWLTSLVAIAIGAALYSVSELAGGSSCR